MSEPTTDVNEIQTLHLGWTKKQGYILSAGGKAEEYYTPERGFPFVETDLPHYHLLKGDTHRTFEEWKSTKPPCSLVAGAWYRPLFAGGWKHSTDDEERVYNIQTHNLFIDLRIPKVRELYLSPKIKDATSLNDLSPSELRLYARQHVFSGFTVYNTEEKDRPVATRHHCMDWNFVGISRPRPNKWWIEMKNDDDDDGSAWKEYAYATDDNGQAYYFERWERLVGGDASVRLALRIAAPSSRKRKSDVATATTTTETQNDPDNAKDGIFVLVGDHFNYMTSRKLSGEEKDYRTVATNLVDLVDAAVDNGDYKTARSYLSIEAGHGLVTNGWKLDCAIPPWNEGKDVRAFHNNDGGFIVQGSDMETCTVIWMGETWELYDCSFTSIDDLKQFLTS